MQTVGEVQEGVSDDPTTSLAPPVHCVSRDADVKSILADLATGSLRAGQYRSQMIKAAVAEADNSIVASFIGNNQHLHRDEFVSLLHLDHDRFDCCLTRARREFPLSYESVETYIRRYPADSMEDLVSFFLPLC